MTRSKNTSAAPVQGRRLDALIKQVQGDLSKELRNKIITLITIDVHSRDIVGALITKRVENAQDFSGSSVEVLLGRRCQGCGHSYL